MSQQSDRPLERSVGRLWWLRILWWFGIRCQKCDRCGFSELARYNHSLEWDVSDYPCEEYQR